MCRPSVGPGAWHRRSRNAPPAEARARPWRSYRCRRGRAILSPANERPWRLLAHVEDEIEPRGKRVPRLGRSHHQLAAEQAVAPVHRLVREIELGREHALLRRLHLDVIVAGTADI